MPDREQAPLVTVLMSLDVMVLQIARDMLESVDIEAYIFDADTRRMLGLYGGQAISSCLMVYADRAVEARERLKELEFI